MSRTTLNFQQPLNATNPNSQDAVVDFVDITAEISYSNGTFLGVRLYHDVGSRSQDDRGGTFKYPYREISRSAIGTGNDELINIPRDYLLWTYTAGTALEAGAKATFSHLRSAVVRTFADRTQDLLGEHNWCRYAFDDQIAIPISTVLLAMCKDESLLEVFDGSKPIYWVPLWHIETAYGKGNQATREELRSGHNIQDIYVTDNDNHYRAIAGAYSRR